MKFVISSSQLPESQARGYKPGRFSFNVKEGSCPQCEGMGMSKSIWTLWKMPGWIVLYAELNALIEDTLSIFYKGKNIYDILRNGSC